MALNRLEYILYLSKWVVKFIRKKFVTGEKVYMEKFQLSENFITKYKRKKPPFGFNGLGELVYMRTYSRVK